MGKRKSSLKAKPLPLKLHWDWNSHIDAVRPKIRELDRKQVEVVALAPRIAISN